MARKKRLNIKFIVILSILLAIPVGGLLVWKVVPKFFPQVGWIWRGTPQTHAEQAKALFDQGKFYEAGEKYKRAVQVRGAPTAEWLVAIGDCYSHMVLNEGMKANENLRLARLFWDQALSIDPNYLDAHRRLLDLFQQNAEMSRGAGAAAQWQQVGELAQKVLSLDPADRAAQLTVHRATILCWINGLEGDDAKVQNAMDSLEQMLAKPPFDPDVFWQLVQARMYRAELRRRIPDRIGALEISEEVKKRLLQTLEEHPESANLHYRAAQTYRLLSAIERSQDQAIKYGDEYGAEMEKANILTKPEDPTYLEIKITWGRHLESVGKSAEAEAVYRQLVKERPDDMTSRILLAELLGRTNAGREEALKLVESYPPADPKVIYGLKAVRYQQFQLAAVAEAVSFKLDDLPNSRTQEQYDKLLKEIEEGYEKLLAEAGEGGPTLFIKGRIELAKGQNIQAVQTLERAAAAPMPATPSPADVEQYYKTLFILARANILVDQTARAKGLLTKVVTDIPRFDPARIQLVQLLLREKSYEEANKHLEALKKSMPGSPVVARLSMLSLDKEKDKDKLKELYAAVPETTPEEMIEKSQLAQYCGYPQEAIRLLERLREGRPDNVELAISLAQLYVEVGDRTKAMELVDSALARSPENARLKLMRGSIAGTDIRGIRKEMVEQIADPFNKNLALFELAMQESREEDALKHAQAAHQLKPDELRVIAILFNFALAQKDWNKATEYMETLARRNYDDAGGLLYRVKYALAAGNLPDAAEKAQQLTQKMPEFAHSWVVLGQVQAAQGMTQPGKYEEARQNFMTALTKQAQNLDAVRGIIGCCYALGQPQTAKRYIDEGRKLFPLNVAMRELEIDYELQHGDPSKAIPAREEMLKQAIEAKSPAEARAWLSLGQAYSIAARKAAAPPAAKPLQEKARDTYKAAMEKWPEELRFVQLYAMTCIQLGATADGEKAIRALMTRDEWKAKPEPVIMLAQYFDRIGKPAEQEKVLRDYLATAPNTVPVQRDLALLLSRRGKLDDALKLLEPSAEDPMIRKLRIELQINEGRLEDALKEINSVLASNPNPPAVLRNRQAFVYMNSGRATEALAVLDKVLAAEPNNTEALLYRATIQVNASRNLDQAIRDLSVVRDTLDDLDSRLLLADALLRKGDEEAAIRELEATVRAKPDEKTPRLRLADLYSRTNPPRWSQAERVLTEARGTAGMANDVELLQTEATMWVGRKDYDKARQAIEAAIKQAPGKVELLETYCEVLLGLRQYQGLIKVTDPFLASKQAPPWVYQYRGRAKKGVDDKTGAMEEWSAGIELASASKDDAAIERIIKTIATEMGAKPAIARALPRADKDNRWRLIVAYLYQTDGDILSAISWVERALAEEASLPREAADTARRMAGAFYLSIDPPDVEKAIANYRKMLEKDGSDTTALNNLACTMIMANSGFTPKDAIAYSQKAHELLQQAGKSDPFVLDTHGYLLVLNGKVEEGIALLHEALDREPIPDAYYHLGEAYLARSPASYAEAKQALSRAKELVEKATGENKPLDSALKAKIEKALVQCDQAPPATQTASQ
jgi:tetratricopeptide (TPR) repeat protein